MEIKFIKVYLTGGKRIQELYEENQRFLQKQEELRKAVRAQDRQMKGYGRDFEALLREREALQKTVQEQEIMLKNMDGLVDKLERMYMQSEDARKSLGEKLEHALGALELLKERKGNSGPSQSLRDSSPRVGESQAERGEGKRAAEDVGPYGEHGVARTMEGGARA